MIQVDEAHWRGWLRDLDADGISRAMGTADLRITMTDDEFEAVNERIADLQMESDPQAEIVDSACVLQALNEAGFHPAFEYGGLVVGQEAFEKKQAESASGLQMR